MDKHQETFWKALTATRQAGEEHNQHTIKTHRSSKTRTRNQNLMQAKYPSSSTQNHNIETKHKLIKGSTNNNYLQARFPSTLTRWDTMTKNKRQAFASRCISELSNRRDLRFAISSCVRPRRIIRECDNITTRGMVCCKLRRKLPAISVIFLRNLPIEDNVPCSSWIKGTNSIIVMLSWDIMLRRELGLFPPLDSFSTPRYHPYRIEATVPCGLTNIISRKTKVRCSLYRPRSRSMLSTWVKLLTYIVGITRNTTNGAESRLVFIDDPLLNNNVIWYGEADWTRQVVRQIHFNHDSSKGHPIHGKSEVITSNRFANNTADFWQACHSPTWTFQEIILIIFLRSSKHGYPLRIKPYRALWFLQGNVIGNSYSFIIHMILSMLVLLLIITYIYISSVF